jgi:hypothetical protein
MVSGILKTGADTPWKNTDAFPHFLRKTKQDFVWVIKY